MFLLKKSSLWETWDWGVENGLEMDSQSRSLKQTKAANQSFPAFCHECYHFPMKIRWRIGLIGISSLLPTVFLHKVLLCSYSFLARSDKFRREHTLHRKRYVTTDAWIDQVTLYYENAGIFLIFVYKLYGSIRYVFIFMRPSTETKQPRS